MPKAGYVAGIVVGAILTFAPLCGALGTAVGMVDTFEEVAVDETPTAEAVAANVQGALLWTVLGCGTGFAGILLIVASIFGLLRSRTQAKPAGE